MCLACNCSITACLLDALGFPDRNYEMTCKSCNDVYIAWLGREVGRKQGLNQTRKRVSSRWTRAVPGALLRGAGRLTRDPASPCRMFVMLQGLRASFPGWGALRAITPRVSEPENLPGGGLIFPGMRFFSYHVTERMALDEAVHVLDLSPRDFGTQLATLLQNMEHFRAGRSPQSRLTLGVAERVPEPTGWQQGLVEASPLPRVPLRGGADRTQTPRHSPHGLPSGTPPPSASRSWFVGSWFKLRPSLPNSRFHL